jgi:lipopolysaccharide transport system permease protein
MGPASMHTRFFQSLWQHHALISILLRRDISGRYRGSLLGWTWSLATPLLTLGVYTFVFSQIFQSRWTESADSPSQSAGTLGFAINLFAGLIVFNIFAETATRSPGIILAYPNYVKKIIFPLQILPAICVGTAMFHGVTSLLILAAFELLSTGSIPITILFIPLVWAPLACGCLAMSWILSALGVYLRDLGHLANVTVGMLLFLSTVFYPIQALPAKWAPLLRANPLVLIIEQTRRVAVEGEMPSPTYLILGILASFAICEQCFRFFAKAKKGFADVM